MVLPTPSQKSFHSRVTKPKQIPRIGPISGAARAEDRRCGPFSALRAHTKALKGPDLLWKTLRNAKGAQPPREGADR